MTYKIAIVVGSLRQDSFNKQLARTEGGSNSSISISAACRSTTRITTATIRKVARKFLQNFVDKYVAWVKRFAD